MRFKLDLRSTAAFTQPDLRPPVILHVFEQTSCGFKVNRKNNMVCSSFTITKKKRELISSERTEEEELEKNVGIRTLET